MTCWAFLSYFLLLFEIETKLTEQHLFRLASCNWRRKEPNFNLLTREEWRAYCRTAKTQYRKFETNIPRKGTARLQSKFLHSYFLELFIYVFPWSVCLFCCRKIGGPNVVIYTVDRSQTHEWGNLDWCGAIPILEIHKSKFLCSASSIFFYNLFNLYRSLQLLSLESWCHINPFILVSYHGTATKRSITQRLCHLM